MTDPTARFLAHADRFAATLAGVGDRWEAPTPCEGWTVRDVVEHVVTTEREFLVRQELVGAGAGDPVAGAPDPAAAFVAHRASVARVLLRDGVADHAYDGYFGPTTVGETLADFYGWDLFVHSWDVAAATGQGWEVTDAEVTAASATADGWGEALHGEGVCGPPVAVPDDAPAGERFLARLGRDPRWRP